MTSIGSTSSIAAGSYAKQLQSFFKSADADKNGGVSQLELEKAGKNLPTGKFSPGVDAESLVKYADGDRDGSLSTAETDAFIAKLGSDAQAYLLQLQETATAQPPEVAELLSQMDRDGDGSVSQSEARSFTKQMQTDMLGPLFGKSSKDDAGGGLDLSSLLGGTQAYQQASGNSMASLVQSMLDTAA